MIKKRYFLLLILYGLLLTSTAYAQVQDNALDKIVTQYASHAQGWGDVLHGYAVRLFGILVLIDFAWMLIRLVISKFDFTDFFGELIRQVFFIGFFFLLLQHSADWANAIVQSFKSAGNAASIASGGSTGLNPSDIFNAGVNLVTTVFNSLKFTFDKPGDSLAIILSCLLS